MLPLSKIFIPLTLAFGISAQVAAQSEGQSSTRDWAQYYQDLDDVYEQMGVRYTIDTTNQIIIVTTNDLDIREADTYLIPSQVLSFKDGWVTQGNISTHVELVPGEGSKNPGKVDQVLYHTYTGQTVFEGSFEDWHKSIRQRDYADIIEADLSNVAEVLEFNKIGERTDKLKETPFLPKP